VPKKNISVPLQADWGNYQSDLEQKSAPDLYAGLTNEEMQPVIIRADEFAVNAENTRYY